MATFALIHGGGSSSWDWHLVVPELRRVGHRAVAVDLPIEDPAAGLSAYADAVVDAVGDADDLIVVAHSLGGFTAPLVADRRPVSLLVYLTAMIPLPGESPGTWWSATGHDQLKLAEGEDQQFFNDVPADLAEESTHHVRDQQAPWWDEPWPLAAMPPVPTRGIACLDDEFFPPDFMRRQIRERLGIEPDEIAGGHYVAISRPVDLAQRLDAYAREVQP